MKPSTNHPNRKSHNWLIYNCLDSFLQKHSHRYHNDIYDLGAGESPYKDFFLQHADHYIAVDWANSFHNTKADITANLNHFLPIKPEIADTVISLSVLEHLCEPQNMLNEAFRILKPGGRIFLQVPWQWCIHEAPCDFFRYTPYGLKYILKKAGFEDIDIEPQTGYFTTTILKWNYFTKRLVRGPKLLRWIIRTCLLPFWYLGQKAAPIMDMLDRNWTLETSGYFVVATKPRAIASSEISLCPNSNEIEL